MTVSTIRVLLCGLISLCPWSPALAVSASAKVGVWSFEDMASVGGGLLGFSDSKASREYSGPMFTCESSRKVMSVRVNLSPAIKSGRKLKVKLSKGSASLQLSGTTEDGVSTPFLSQNKPRPAALKLLRGAGDLTLNIEGREQAYHVAKNDPAVKDFVKSCGGRFEDDRPSLQSNNAANPDAKSQDLKPAAAKADAPIKTSAPVEPFDCRQEEKAVGAWKLQFCGNAKPSAELLFKNAVIPEMGPPHIESLIMSCAGGGKVEYHLNAPGHHYRSFSFEEGEASHDFKLDVDGALPSREAARFISSIMPSIRSYDSLKQTQQMIRLMTPDGAADEINFYGFSKVRAALKRACARPEAVAPQSPSQSPSALASPVPGDEKAESAVMMMLYGATTTPHRQVVSWQLPFNKSANATKDVRLTKLDNCRYAVDVGVQSSDEMAFGSGAWKYKIDFSKAGTIDVALANNAYEALSWDPMMFLYPSQKEQARRHVVSKVVRVTLNSDDPKVFCAQNLTKKGPEHCSGSHAFEINPDIASLKRISDATNFFKTKICQGRPF